MNLTEPQGAASIGDLSVTVSGWTLEAEREQEKTGADLIRAWRDGDEHARDALFQMIQRELEKIASYLLRRENQPISIVTGDLVNEAIVKLLQSESLEVNDRAHILALAARVMRHVLVDAARRKSAQKREVGLVALTTGLPEDRDVFFEMQALEKALVRLAVIAPERAQIVELRYYAGMSVEEVAEAIGVSPATVIRSWASPRLWLKDAIRNDFAG